MSEKTKRREFLQLADTFNAEKHKIAGHYISEKLDGTRCLWDGGITRGMKTENVPYASVIDPKTGEKKGKIKPYATGLWSRYGNPIMAPDWFLNQLPCVPLDGELWAGRGNFQLCRSICGGDTPDPRFNKIKYAVYSTPSISYLFESGEIKNANMVCTLDREAIGKWIQGRLIDHPDFSFVVPPCNFDGELLFLRENIPTQDDFVFLHQQVRLANDEVEARKQAFAFCESVLDKGGEGCVIRDPAALWTPKRHKGLLKFKPFEDDEAKVVGFIAGRKGKQGNVLGKIGALIVKWGDVEFELGSGLTMADRELGAPDLIKWAETNPGERIPFADRSKHFKVGETVTFKYRELSDEGIPKEGRFWRKRDVE
jgi:DNA ligase-1